MKNHGSTGGIVIAMLGAVILLTICEKAVFGQRQRPPSVERRLERLSGQLEQNEHENLRREKNSRTDERTKALAEAQVKKDFEGIQLDYNRIVVAMNDKQNVDYDAVYRAVAEISKRAARLKENLALPEIKEEENQKPPAALAAANAKDALLQLRKLVYSFVTNSIFEAPTVLDVEQAKKASRDLDKIIQISKNIEKKVN